MSMVLVMVMVQVWSCAYDIVMINITVMDHVWLYAYGIVT